MGTQACPFIYVLSATAMCYKRQKGVVATEAMWPQSLTYLPFGFLQKTFANPGIDDRPPYCCLQPVSDSPLFLKKSLKLSTGPTRLLAHRLVPRDLRATPILLFSFTSEHVACSLLFPSAKLFLTPRRSARAVLSTRRFCPSAAPSPSPTAELTPALRAVCSGQFSHPTYGYVSSPWIISLKAFILIVLK